MTFDDAIPELLVICQRQKVFDQIKEGCLVRDLRGRLRLVIDPGPNCTFALTELTKILSTKLQGYFAPPILSTKGSVEHARLARSILERATEWPATWPDVVPTLDGTEVRPKEQNMRAFQRVLTKDTWLTKHGRPAWPPMEGETPSIVSFYSFKGGVGRTMLVGIVAYHLASLDYRVAVVDLDLEAPGLSTLMDAWSPRGRGVLDFVVDHLATGSADLEGIVANPNAVSGNLATQIDVVGAGTLGWPYIEKLARLDFASSQTEESSPTGRALEALLKRVRSDLQPDFILLDSRAGLHDLGGLSLHALAHVDVLVSRAGPQGEAGLKLTLEALVRCRNIDEFQCVVVHAFAPTPESSELGKVERNQFRERSYELFQDHIYTQLDEVDADAPSFEDEMAPHYPWVVGQFPGLERVSMLADIDAADLGRDDFKGLSQRICELCGLSIDPD